MVPKLFVWSHWKYNTRETSSHHIKQEYTTLLPIPHVLPPVHGDHNPIPDHMESATAFLTAFSELSDTFPYGNNQWGPNATLSAGRVAVGTL